MKSLIFWFSYLAVIAIPVLFAAAVLLRGWWRLAAAGLLSSVLVLTYARFIEPRILLVNETEIVLPGARQDRPPLRIALVSDTHIGTFGNAMPIDRIVNAINRQAVDGVFIAGDLVYHIDVAEIDAAFAPLADLNAPVFAVFGNHDVGFPGPDVGLPLSATLKAHGVQFMHNRVATLEAKGQSVRVLGTSDFWQRLQDFSGVLGEDDGPLFILTHNPDTAMVVPPEVDYDLMLAGHTHGAQIRLPLIHQRYIPTKWPFDKGLYTDTSQSGDKYAFVTAGTGMVGLPMRFLIPPRIDILTVHLPDD